MAEPLERLTAALADRYRIERELGAGGMATVYLARDLRHDREVAIKVLRPELAATLGPQRFLQEIQIAARLTHPHILPLHDSGQAADVLYYVMPYVEGESLRDKLSREGELPVAEVVRILKEVTDALAYAHGHGVVHRDIKPENVMLSGRHALVTDFGVAKALHEATGRHHLTTTGVALGTPAYMAPEQAAADPHMDHRVDLYAVGALGYELLTGRPPFTGTSPQMVLAAQVTEVPRPVTDYRPAVPPAMAATIMRCLEILPADRWQTGEEVLQQLEQVLTLTDTVTYRTAATPRRNLLMATVVVAGFAAIGILGWQWWQGRSAETTLPASSVTEAGVDGIAVLPFQNLGDTSYSYFADGITDAVRGKLMALAGIDVIDRSSSLEYQGTDKRPSTIASELGVQYLLTGTVRFAMVAGTKYVQVRPELVEISDDGMPHGRWQESYEGELKDVFRIQAEIAQRVADGMRLALADTVRARLAKAPTSDSAAYDLYLRAVSVAGSGSGRDGATRAVALLEQAVARDSMMIEAWEMASRLRSGIQINWPTARNGEAALAAAQRALALAPNGAAGHRAMARYYEYSDPAKALQEAELALRAEPDDIGSLRSRARAKFYLGLRSGDTTSKAFDESLRDGQRVLRLDPRNASAWGQQAWTLLNLRRVREARLAASRGLALNPASFTAIRYNVLVELIVGNLDGARQVLTSARNDVNRPRLVADMAEGFDMGWVLDTDDERLLLTLGPETFNSPTGWAMALAQQYRWRGDTAQARAWGDSLGQFIPRDGVPLGPLQVANYGLGLALQGRAREALEVVDGALALAQSSPDAGRGYHWYMLARAALLAGDPTRAIELLRRVLRLPYFVTPAWLRIDPSWAALRGYPPFEDLLTPKG